MALSHTLALQTMTTPARPTTVRFPELVDDALDALAEHYALDRSNMLRFLVMEKARALGLVHKADAPPPVASSPGSNEPDASKPQEAPKPREARPPRLPRPRGGGS
jgi:hypothetical protein